MSFANYDLEAQKSLKMKSTLSNVSLQSESQNQLDKIIQKTSKQLQLFGTLLSQFDNQRKLVGSKRDSIHFRTNNDELIKNTSDLDHAIQVLIQNISQLINKRSVQSSKKDTTSVNGGHSEEIDESSYKLEITNKQIVIKERLVVEFNELHNRFQNSLRQYNEKKNSYPIKIDDIDNVDERSPLVSNDRKSQSQSQIQIQQQAQLEDQDQVNETELQYHIMLTEERNREINQVSQGIQEVNLIFKDLGELVHQQGEQLDTVEDNIFQLHGNTQQADKELRKADQYQRSKGKWSCIILIALCIFVLVVVLIVLS